MLLRILYPLIESYVSMTIYRKQVDIELYTFSQRYFRLSGMFCNVHYLVLEFMLPL